MSQEENSPGQADGHENSSGNFPESLLDGMSARTIFEHIMPGIEIPSNISDQEIMKLIVEMFSEPEKRKKLPEFNTLEDAINLLRNSKKILILTGAGVSVSCGIPDFRSKNGIYARLHKDFPDLPDPQAMFDIEYFKNNPVPFFDFAREIYPGQFKPSLSHLFIKALENNGQLLRNYTQNIDTLEQVAEIHRVVQCHGSFATATCCICKYKVNSEFIRQDIFERKVPRCPKCPNSGQFSVLKPDITFFGESLSKEFYDCLETDKTEADLVIVVGSSLKVRPVSLIPNSVSNKIPQILINREPLNHMNFDIELLGDCDDVINELCRRLGPPWNSTCDESRDALSEIRELPLNNTNEFDQKISPQCSSLGAVQKSESVSGIDKLKGTNKLRLKKISNCLPDKSYLFIPPNRYIFKGAEVYKDLDPVSGGSLDSSGSSDEEERDCTKLGAPAQDPLDAMDTLERKT